MLLRTVVIGAGRFDPKKHTTECGIWKRYGGEGVEDTRVQAAVLEYTIRKHLPPGKGVRIINTYAMQRPMLKKQRNPTPFSLVRFWVPELCDFKGQAVYLDADMIVFDDINKLFDACDSEHPVWRCGRESVLAYDCEQLRHWDVWKWRDEIDSGKRGYKPFMLQLAGQANVGAGPSDWNHLDKFDKTTKLLHYTRLSTQPWRPNSQHPHKRLWWVILQEAIEAGAVTAEDLDCGLLCDKEMKNVTLPPVSPSVELQPGT